MILILKSGSEIKITTDIYKKIYEALVSSASAKVDTKNEFFICDGLPLINLTEIAAIRNKD